MGENFLSLSPENLKKCKQIIFPAGFYMDAQMDAQKNVYTPEISPLYRLATNKKTPAHTSDVFLVRLEGWLQNFSTPIQWKKLYLSLQKMERGNQNLAPKRRLRHSPARRALDVDALVADYQVWQSVRKVAETYGVDRKTATALLKKAGITLRLPGYPGTS